MAEADMIGRRVGEFVLRQQIGEGAFGAVFLAEQPSLERHAVVKVSHATAAADPARVNQFLREARLASRIDHPFAAHIYAFGAEPDGALWIAMELVRGTSLADMLDRGPLPPERAIPLLARLCEVVHTVHENGIVHQDIKPGNVMVVSRAGAMFPKLLDLGMAGEIHRAPSVTDTPMDQQALRRSRIAGTPLYMAPEQWVAGSSITPQTDIYALGVLAYELLVGQPPFNGASLMEVAAAHARNPVPEVPEALHAFAAVLARAMAKRAKDRFATALEFAAAVRDASGLAIDAVNLPSIDIVTREEALVAAPQPIAESVALLDGARTPAQLRLALWRAATTVAQFVGGLALALRQRASGRYADTPLVQTLLQRLSRDALGDEEWWTLTREVVRPFAGAPILCPIPELVEMFFERGTELRTAMDGLLAARAGDPGPTAPPDALRSYLVGAVGLMGQVLRALRFLHGYTIAVVEATGQAESWMGLRRARRSSVDLRHEVPRGPVLLDRDGVFVCSLAPVIECAEPAPGALPEMFLLVGATQGRARMLASPHALEIRRDDVWEHFGLGSDADPIVEFGERAGESPYLGLATFSAHDKGKFFGREAEVMTFINRMIDRPFIAVVGPSGAGKSSFVQAGVIPNLHEQRTVLLMRPGKEPFAALAAAALGNGRSRVPDGVDAVAAVAEEILASLRQAVRRGETSPLIVVDQFEELVTLCPAPATQQRFAELLVEISTGGLAAVVVTLRDDFLLKVAQLPALRDRLAASLHLLTTPTDDDLRRILTEPARQVGYTFEDQGLVDEIVEEVSKAPAALALLSFTAYQLWQFRDKHLHHLSRKAYHELGRVGGAMAWHAETIMGQLREEDRPRVRELFRHLVTADGTRATLSRGELLEVAGGAAAEPVLEHLISGRLLVAQEGTGGQERIEVIHEALLDAWPRLVKWRQEDADGARLRDQLRAAAKQWHERGRARGLLWREEALAEYQAWQARYPGALTAIEMEFGRASIAAQARQRRWRRALVIAAVAVLLAGLILLFGANRRTEFQRERAQTLLDAARYERGRELAVQGNWREAAKAWIKVLEHQPFDHGLRFLVGQAMTTAHRVRWAVAVAAKGAKVSSLLAIDGALIVGYANGTAAALDVATGATRWTVRLAAPVAVERIDRHDRGVALASPVGVTIVDARGGIVETYPSEKVSAVCGDAVFTSQRNALVRHQPGRPAAVVSIDGGAYDVECLTPELLVVQTGEGTWSWRGDRLSRLGPKRASLPWFISVAEDKSYVAAVYTSPEIIDVFDTSTWRLVASLRGHASEVNYVAFGSGGAWMLSSDIAGDVRLWDLATGSFEPLRHEAMMLGASVSAAGDAVTVDINGTTRRWRGDGTPVAELDEMGPATRVVALAGGALGARLVAVGYGDGTVRAIDLGEGEAQEETPIGTQFYCLDVNRRGERIACTSPGGIDVYDRAGRWRRALPLDRDLNIPISVALSDLGAIAVAKRDATAVVRYGASPASPPRTVAIGAAVRRVVALHDRDWIVALASDGLHVVNDADHQVRVVPGISVENQFVLAAHPSKPWVAAHAAGAPSAIVVVDASTGEVVREFDGESHATYAMRFSSDGGLLYAGGDDGVVRAWKIDSGVLVAAYRGHRGEIYGIAEIDDGLLASLGDDGLVVWNTKSTIADVSPILFRRRVSSQFGFLHASGRGGRLYVINSATLRAWHMPAPISASALQMRAWLLCAASMASRCDSGN